MSLRRHLRQRDSNKLALEMLRDRHPGSEVTELTSEQRYLQLWLENEQGDQAHAWFNVDLWLAEMGAHLPEIPWQEVPLDYLARWFNHLQLSFLLEDNIWTVEQIATCTTSMPELALYLPAEPCSLICLEWPDSDQSIQREQAIAAERVPLRLQFVLGSSQLTLAQLVDLAPGDLLLIKRNFAHLSLGHRPLFKLSYHLNQEVIVEEPLAERYQDMQEDEILHDWHSLPVEIEFVLDGKTVTLAELDGIKPGMALALTPDAEQNIKIYLNKKQVARGELVVLENGTLAVEINHVNPTLVSNPESTDAE